MDVPALTYLKTLDEQYDYDFQGMPNRLSQQCFALDELIAVTGRILAGSPDERKDPDKEALMNNFITARAGQLASDRILDILDQQFRRPGSLPTPSTAGRLQAKALTRIKATLTRLNMQRPGPNRQAYHDHRFPQITVTQLEEKIRRLGKVLQRFDNVRVQQHSEHVFHIGS